MNVFFSSYPTIGQNIGGLQIQISNTKNELEKLGINVKLFNIWEDKISDCDILHIFSINDVSQLSLCLRAKQEGKKVVVSTVYYGKKGFLNYKEKLQYYISKLKPSLSQNKWAQSEILKHSDAVIALSDCEKKYIEEIFPFCKGKVHIVPNGIASDFIDKKITNSKEILINNGIDLKDFVLNVAQIYKCKNQIKLIEAMLDLDYPLVLIGQQIDKKYYQECLELIKKKSNIYILPPVKSNDPLLKALYQEAKTFVLPSLHEVYPLTVLEAIATDNHIVVTTESMLGNSLNDYSISLVDPNDVKTISKEIDKKMQMDRIVYTNDQKQRLSWKSAIGELFNVYQKIY